MTALDYATGKKGNQDSNPGLRTHVQFGEFIFYFVYCDEFWDIPERPNGEKRAQTFWWVLTGLGSPPSCKSLG